MALGGDQNRNEGQARPKQNHHLTTTTAGSKSTTNSSSRHTKCLLALATTCAMALWVGPGQAHDQLARSPRPRPPAIYSYSGAAGEPPLSLESHRSRVPYSWSNQRLARVLAPAEEETNDVEEHDSQMAMGSMGELHHSHMEPERDFSLLYGPGQSARSPPTVGTKTTRTSSVAGTKTSTRRRQPAPGANRRRVGGGGATKGAPPKSTSSTKSATSGARRKAAPPVVAAAPDFSPSHAAEANTTTDVRRATAGKRKNLVCYYGTWAVYRPDGGKFPVELIDPFLCTHVIYGFTGLSYDNMIKPLDPWNDLEDNYGKGAMKRFTNLKRVNPDLKTIVAIGGWNEGSIKYSKMASEPEARAKFIDSVVKFLEKYNFDGLDLDWEYPGSRGGASYDKQNFVRLTRELHEAFRPRGYLLTAAVSAGKWFIDPAYDIPQVSRYLDLINLMAYDYHGGWETKTGMNAPLFSSRKHDLSREDQMLNVNWSVNYWLQQGAPREKLMLGVGSYGRSFTLDKNQVNGLNAPASQKGQAGPYTREPGSLGYNELCEYFQRSPSSWTIVRDPDYLAPYAYNNERQWVGYDDQESLALKAQFAKSMGLGGMMMWSIETDDFRGQCHGEKFPLLNTIRRVLDGQSVLPPSKPTPSTTTTSTTVKPEPIVPQRPRPSTTTRRPQTQRPPTTSTRRPGGEVEDDQRPPPASSTTRRPPVFASSTTSTRRPRPPVTPPQPPAPPAEFTCRQEGMFADPRNCRKFIRCVSLGSGWQTYKFDCGPGTAFNEQQGYCDHIYNVPSCSSSSSSQSTASQRTMIGSSGPLGPGNNNNNYLPPARVMDQHLVLARQYYPNYFQHQFMVRHQWLH